MRARRLRLAVVIVFVLSLVGASLALAAGRNHGHGHGHGKAFGAFGHGNDFSTHLTGYQEVPSINSPAQGDLTITLGNNQLTYQLTYSGFTTAVSAAHVHVAQPGVNGGVSFFLCGGGNKPACPTSGGTVTGTVVPSDVLAISGQGFAAGDLNAVLAAMRAGVTYANIHTATYPNGEIRGQLLSGKGGKGHFDEDDDD
jgi:hypothetical protein